MRENLAIQKPQIENRRKWMKKPINEQPRNSQNHSLPTETIPHLFHLIFKGPRLDHGQSRPRRKRRLHWKTDVPCRDEAIPAERMIKALWPHKLTGQSVRCDICASLIRENNFTQLDSATYHHCEKDSSSHQQWLPSHNWVQFANFIHATWWQTRAHRQSTDRPTRARMPWRIVTSVVSKVQRRCWLKRSVMLRRDRC